MNLKEECVKTALKSDFKKKNYRHGAILVYNGHIIGRGVNQNVWLEGYERYNEFQSIHAEVHCLLRMKNKHNVKILRNSEMYVCRLNRQGQLLMSKPCKTCQKFIASFGIKTVWYSTEKGWESYGI